MSQCVFCQIIAGQSHAHVVYEDDECIAFLDKYPQTRGHIQLVPKIHYRWIWDVPEMGSIFTTAQRIIQIILPVLGASHVTLGTFGREIKHAHLWIVPQYDTSMTVQEGMGKGRSENEKEKVAKILREALAQF